MTRFYIIDHRVLFLFGFSFYLITPLLVGRGEFFDGLPGISLYQGYFDLIPDEKLWLYTIISLLWLPAFFLGHYFYGLVGTPKRNLARFPASPVTHATDFIGYTLLIVLVMFAYLGRNSLFAGYASYDVAARGKLSSLLVVFNFFIAYQLISKRKMSVAVALGAILTALLLLSMGGRMYVFQTFIVLLVYKTSFASNRWRVSQIILLVLVAFFVATAAGIWRMGDSLNWQKAAYSILAEPMFTWFSTSTFLSGNDIPLFHFPSNFITSFINIIPNSVVNLNRFVVSTKQMGFDYENPLGAESAWTTFVINFGSIGSLFFIFITGFFLHYLRNRSAQGRFAAVYYILVCSILPFQFFRDGFYIVNKQLIFNFFILPAAIIFFITLVEYTQFLLISRSAHRENGSQPGV